MPDLIDLSVVNHAEIWLHFSDSMLRGNNKESSPPLMRLHAVNDLYQGGGGAISTNELSTHPPVNQLKTNYSPVLEGLTNRDIPLSHCRCRQTRSNDRWENS